VASVVAGSSPVTHPIKRIATGGFAPFFIHIYRNILWIATIKQDIIVLILCLAPYALRLVFIISH
jgi:hypothetical protein